MGENALPGTWIATVRMRRGDGWQVKPECEAMDGRRVKIRFGWAIEGDHSRYPGEAAWLPIDDAPIGWIASGDLADWERADG